MDEAPNMYRSLNNDQHFRLIILDKIKEIELKAN